MNNDSALIDKAQRGDANAFEQIVLKYEAKIYNIAYRYTGSQQDALDISQETFVKIYRSLSSFKGESALSTWIYRVATNVSIDYIRREGKKQVVSIDDEEGPTGLIVASSGSPDKELEQKEFRAEMQQCLLLLSDEHREAVVLRDVESFSYEEIAEILSVSEGTVKSRIARARKKLRAIILSRGNITAHFPSNAVGGNE